ncbi:MFS transporter [Cryptosporangium arvum]|uniref:Nitrate/nitrite transporter n=1 Tax=Cryptosporangium arvum DSM 44712 TaxID=927661 RepID=A0A010YL87_9ACTN|nr:nitrate/nitrite transporter [Cryptosporangium arvum]EXG81000.1 nitrate/nitrite transporter [Cryptosporangium arvum DSM 44712]
MAAPTITPVDPTVAPRRSGRWIDDWRPEDPAFWASGGAAIARRNLIFSILSEHIGFSIWTMWSVLVLFLPADAYGLTPDDKFLLTAVPAFVGAFLRLPYTFAVAKFGGRNWTIVSASLLLVPSILTAALLEPGVSFGTLLILAAFAGVGGGNFSSSMANINAFYPNRLKGMALGLNAAGGNLGVALVQVVGLIVLAAAGGVAASVEPRLVPGLYLPLILVVTVLSAVRMDNLTHASNDKRAMRDVVRDRHSWIMSLLYIGTFGSFIGFSFAFGQVLIAVQGVTPVDALKVIFLGPLLGSIARPAGGWLADRFGGARITLWTFVGMGLFAALVLMASQQKSLALFYVGFIALFVLSGVGNGSTYKMIPAIFRAKAQRNAADGADADWEVNEARRLSSALVGVAGAIGACGGALVQIVFRQSFLTYQNADAAYVGFIALYAVCFAVTWFVYLRRSPSRLAGV